MGFLRIPSADPLADLDDEDVQLLQEPVEIPPCVRNEWWEKFQYDLYDWDDPEFKRKNRGPGAYVPILLTQGYFMMVSPRSYAKITTHPDGSAKRWWADVRTHPETGEVISVKARRSGNRKFGEPRTILSHRELLGIINDPLIIGDHINGWGLDNRGDVHGPVNLVRTDSRVNGHNAVREREDNLPTGVEARGKKDNLVYGGKVCIRVSTTKVITIRSKRRWKNPLRAATWYQNYLKRAHKRTAWAHNPKSVNFPIFPPLKQQERTAFPHTQALKASKNISTPF